MTLLRIFQKKLLLPTLTGALLLFNATVMHAQSTGATWTCPMHPQIHASKPGSCPICGMDLVKENPKKTRPKTAKKPVETPHAAELPVTTPEKKVLAPIQHDSIAPQPMEQMGMEKPAMPAIAPPAIVPIDKPSRTVRYDLYVRDTTVNFTGKPRRAIAVNGQIPMPELSFTEGDTALIYVHNELDETTTLHWHGLFLPNKEDGVPYLTQMPIAPHSTHAYTFPIIQHGTHWYHSHSGLQEQIGMYGAFLIKKKDSDPTFRKGIDDLPTASIVLSEWTNMNPNNVHRMLHNATDWFAIKKGSTQSYTEAIKQGYLKTKVANEWKRMNAMDVSDVYFNRFLVNGEPTSHLDQFKPGERVRLQIANGSASTYFWLSYGGGKITVVANDGNDVEPVTVDRLLIAVSETYDVVVTLPDDCYAYDFVATAEDRTQAATVFLGPKVELASPPMPKLKYFEGMKMMNGMMKMNGRLDDMGMHMSLNKMDMNAVMYPEITGMSNMDEMPAGEMKNDKNTSKTITTLNYAMLKSPTPTALPSDATYKELRFVLTGNMNRYVWSLNNRVLSETDKILIKKGQNVRIILYNGSMMRHPMHLHGHDFRLLNGQGDYAPLKNIVDIMPMETDTLEFNANASGDWFFHCHILYHMMSGMGRVFSYEGQQANPLIPNPKLAQKRLYGGDQKFHSMARIGLETNGSDGEAMLANTRWKVGTLWHLGWSDHHGYESETSVGRYIGRMQWLYAYAGFDYHYKTTNHSGDDNIFGAEDITLLGQKSNKNNRKAAVAGLSYTLPMLLVADARIDSDGKFRLQIGREDIPLAKRLRLNFMLNSDKEYMLGARYILTKLWSVSSHYDSDMGIGIGATFTY